MDKLIQRVRTMLGKTHLQPKTVMEAIVYVAGKDNLGVAMGSYRGYSIAELEEAVREVLGEAAAKGDQ